MKTLTTSAMAVLLFSIAVTGARAEWRVEGETGFFYDNNLSNSDRSADQEPDGSWKTDMRLLNSYQLLRDLRLTVAADLQGQVWSEYTDFNRISPGAETALRYRFGLGRLAPWIMVENRIGYDRFHGVARSGWNESAGLRAGFAISDRIAFETGYLFENFVVPDNFFDVQSHRLGARVMVDLTSSLQVTIGYDYREGDVIAYAVPPRPEIAAFAVEREEVTTFGTDPLYTGYRFPGRSHIVSVSAVYLLTRHFSVSVGYEYASTSHDPLRYENHLVEAKVAFAF
ncbi:MAG: hypothetical protein ACJ8M1_11495 [Chthoniobacterales bacterium]